MLIAFFVGQGGFHENGSLGNDSKTGGDGSLILVLKEKLHV